SAHCARLRSVARTISLPVRMPAASALRSSTRYSAQRSSTALNQKATFVMCSSASPSTRSIESTSCCRGSLPKNCKPRSTSRTHKARREDRTLTEQAQSALEHIQAWMHAHGLQLHPHKTRIGDCRVPGEGFDFLGYRFEAGRRTVRRKSLRSFKDRVRQRTRRTGGQSLQSVIDTLNPMLRGWFNDFKHAHVYTFRALDGFIRRRLRSILRHHAHRPGRGVTPEDHRRWSNAYFVERGLF